MACEEARAMLDALMGGDRNAPLPPGAAMPRSKKKRRNRDGGGGGGEMLLLPGKRSKSCYDPDIDPLYCAWGIDVFELFVNTKSDIGPNPYVVDEGARKEFIKLPPQEQERMGYHYFLFQKLQELVRNGDRTVQRNKEKLAQELRRLAAKRANNQSSQQQPVVDYVQDVDEQAIESLARNQLEFEFLHEKLESDLLVELDKIVQEEENLKEELSTLLEQQREKDEEEKKEKESSEVKKEDGGEEEKEKEEKEKEGDEGTNVKQEEQEDSKEGSTNVKQEENAGGGGIATVKEEEQAPDKKNPRIQSLQIDLGKLTLQKQRLLWEIAKIMSQVCPLQEAMEGQHRNLLYVKSDIAADKTVCEVSGNFMSARDADERIAAHYAGKQYVGWKLVREKFKEMISKYGRYGPPPPDRSGNNRGGGPPPGPPMGMHRGGGAGPPRSSGGGGFGRGSAGFGGHGRGDRRGDRGGGWGRDRDRDRGGRWERHGPGGPPGNRGGGWRR